MNNIKELAKKIKDSNLTISSIAKKSNCSRGTIYKILDENCKYKISLDMYERVSNTINQRSK